MPAENALSQRDRRHLGMYSSAAIMLVDPKPVLYFVK